MHRTIISAITALIFFNLLPVNLNACSTFKFQKGGDLIYGHNLDEPGMRIPGIIYINKRGVFKTGRSFGEMFAGHVPTDFIEEYLKPSKLCWISRFGSLTFSAWGPEFPDGGFNEAGLFIWEMGMVGTEYPKNEKLPNLLKMSWMQYILDNFCTLDDALEAAHSIQVEGWQWHYFVGDAQGNCASVEFIDGEVVIHQGEQMPVPGLFNEFYDREMEFLHYFKGFGGLYEPVINDKRVPRFVKTAVMLRDYDPSKHIPLDYSKSLLYEVGNKPYKWGILFDVVHKMVYFNTEINQEWKYFSCNDIDFSNAGPTMILDLDQPKGGDVIKRFHPIKDSEIEAEILEFGLPDSFFEYFGFTRDEFAKRFSTAYHEGENPERQYFKGVWNGESAKENEDGTREQMTLELNADCSVVSGSVNYRGETHEMQQISLIDKILHFAFRTDDGTFIFPQGTIDGRFLDVKIYTSRGYKGSYLLEKQ